MVTARDIGARSPSTARRETASVLGFVVGGLIGAVLLLGAFYLLGTVLNVGQDCNRDDCAGQWED
jgi:hypothetical protein